MPARSLRDWIQAQRARASGRAREISIVGFLVGLIALPAIALGHSWIGLVSILAGRAIAVLGRREELDCIVFASLPFAFTLADPGRALAAAFVLFGFVVFVSSKPERIAASEQIVCTLAFALACLFVNWFSLVAYALGIACFAIAGVRLARNTA